jgi:diguanylate cyclase (GGDEF)-like protein/PAS domain S-box-containing protein
MGNHFNSAVDRRAPSWWSRLLLYWQRQPSSNRTRLAVLATGFVSTLLVIAVVIGVSLYSMTQIRASLEQLSEHVQRKMVEVATMRENLYLRIVSSRSMLFMTDVFEIDAEAQQFRIYPTRIYAAYQRFLKLTTDPVEVALAEKFMDEARMGQPLLDGVVEQLLAKKHPDQFLPQIQQAFDTQKLGLETLLTLQDHLQNHGIQLTKEAVDRYERTRLLVIWLTALAVVLVLGISIAMAVLLEQHTAELDREHRKFKALFETNRDAVLILADDRIAEFNPHAQEWFGERGRDSLTGLRIEDLSSPQPDDPPVSERLRAAMASASGATFEWMIRNQRGEPHHVEVTVTPLPGGSPPQHQIVIRDMTARIVELQKVSYEAAHDPLTGIPNRREFERRTAIAIRNAVREETEHVLCYLDLDKFKSVNDSAGHAAGDELLKQVATLLRSRARSGDLLARLGGDEFGLLLENCSLEHGIAIGHAIVRDVGANQFNWDGQTYRFGISIGLVTITHRTDDLDLLLATADQACYKAKRDPSHVMFSRMA